MAFRASKERKRKDPDPIGRGVPVTPNAGIMRSYTRKVMAIVKIMVAEYKRELTDTLDHPEVAAFYAEDAMSAAATRLSKRLKQLEHRWKDIFEGFASEQSKAFVDDTEKNATGATLHSLSIAGLKQPRATYNEYVQATMQAAVDYNHTLIVGIADDVHEKIYTSVMLSLTSPNPDEQGTSGIMKTLRDVTDFADKRIKFIAEDQTSKLYSALSDDRMRENGVEEFEWLHSSAGETPRPSHLKMDGHIFKLNDPIFWELGGPFGLKKGDLGPPGWACRCRCRRAPIIR